MDSAIEDFSLLDPRVQSNPRPFYAVLHEQCPVYRIPETGVYMVTRYDDVRAVLRDTETFSSDISTGNSLGGGNHHIHDAVLEERGWSRVRTLQRTDPPLHGRYRRLLDEAFNILRVQELTPEIEAVANDLIDQFIDRGECEFVSAFALPLPGIIIAGQLGLDRSGVPRFKRWADALMAPAMGPLSEAEMRAVAETEVELQHHLADLFAQRRAQPKPDLISALVNARMEGEEPLSMHELQNVMAQLVSGGYETTTSAFANGLWLLLRFPDQMQKLRARPELLKGFVDEALRYESPVQGLTRRTTRAVEMGGATIPEGATVIVRYGAANHDPAKFECPHLFDIERKNAGAHIAFGSGVHFCVGQLLAKHELLTGFACLLNRLDDIELARPLPDPPHLPSLLWHPLKELPIRFRAVA